MERNIPHVLDIFAHSPGAKRRARERRENQDFSSKLKEQQKNPGSDSAVSLGSSEEDEDERNISKYFDYLDGDHSFVDDRKSKANGHRIIKSESSEILSPRSNDVSRESRKTEQEKDIRYIERHLSMKKTIRKKMMRDLQQAFVENPGEFQQDPARISSEMKSNINIENLTISKKRLSKSEHSFLDMLKDEDSKGRNRPSNVQVLKAHHYAASDKKLKNCSDGPKRNTKTFLSPHDDDSGNDSPTRESSRHKTKKEQNRNLKISDKDDKKPSLWKRLTGKSKNKR